MLTRLFSAAVVVAALNWPVNAADLRLDISVGRLLDIFDTTNNPDLRAVFEAGLVNIEEGLATANAILKDNGQLQLYCTPEDLPVNVDMLISMLRERSTEVSLFEILSVAEGVFAAMAHVFPCDEPAAWAP